PLVLRLVSMYGCGCRNAIPRVSVAVFAADETTEDLLLSVIEQESAAIKQEFATVDEALEITLERREKPAAGVLPMAVQTKLIQTLYAAPHGVYRLSV